jgi:alanine dehydrogenase
MNIGIPKEIKSQEDRVSLTPAGAHALGLAGHRVLVERGAGSGSGFTDEEYARAGAGIVDAASAWDADLVVKVKEPLESEYRYFRREKTLFTYLHLAPEPELAGALAKSGITAIAYETVQLPDRSLPLLTPMSEIAGRMAVQIGAHFLEKEWGGKGALLGGVPGVYPCEVAIVGGGEVGTNAARLALGTGANVTVIDINLDRLRRIEDIFGGRVRTLMSNPYNIAEAVARADLLIGAVLVRGSRAPKLVSIEMVKRMSPGSVIVDVAIDQGGSIETVDHATTHADPTYVKFGVVHYSVANMPGAVPRTSTLALTNATLPYILAIAGMGTRAAVEADPALLAGVNVAGGSITCEPVARDLGLPWVPPLEAMGA